MSRLFTTALFVGALTCAPMVQAATPLATGGMTPIAASAQATGSGIVLTSGRKHHKHFKKHAKRKVYRHRRSHRDYGRRHDLRRRHVEILPRRIVRPHDYHRDERRHQSFLIENPRRYGLTRYNRYEQRNGNVYAIDSDTGAIIALIGLAATLLNY